MPTTPNRAYPYPALANIPDVPADIQALAVALDTDIEAISNQVILPEPMWVESTASNAIVATSYAALPNPVTISMTGVPDNCVIAITWHCWIATGGATGSQDVRVGVDVSGCGLSVASGSPTGHAIIRNVDDTTDFGTLSFEYSKRVKTTAAGTLSVQVKAERSSASFTTSNVNYVGLYVTPLGVFA